MPIATVSKFVYTDTPATLQAEIKQVKNDSFALTLVGTTLPLSALIIGFVLLVAAVLLRRRGEDPRPVSDQSTPALVVSR